MKPLKALAISDLHCGNPRLDPIHFTACICEYVLPKITKELDYLFICGDFFDLLVTMNSAASFAAMTVISKLKEECFKNDVKLRVLRGTYTHDRDQPKHFMTASPEYNSCVEVVDSMCIEYDKDLDTTILYMPDNLSFGATIYEHVEKLLKLHMLDKVDIVIHHGYFKHMLPPGIPEPSGTLDFEIFKKFYKGCVLNGHVHTTSIHQNVISVGSFDRFAYGEEEDKGFYIVKRDDTGKYSYEFVKNEHAIPFWTINLKDFDNQDIRPVIDHVDSVWGPKIRRAREMKLPVHIRLVTNDSGIMDGMTQYLRDTYPHIAVDRGVATKKEQILEKVAMDLSELPVITPDNVADLAIPIIKKMHPDASDEELKAVIDGCKIK